MSSSTIVFLIALLDKIIDGRIADVMIQCYPKDARAEIKVGLNPGNFSGSHPVTLTTTINAPEEITGAMIAKRFGISLNVFARSCENRHILIVPADRERLDLWGACLEF